MFVIIISPEFISKLLHGMILLYPCNKLQGQAKELHLASLMKYTAVLKFLYTCIKKSRKKPCFTKS